MVGVIKTPLMRQNIQKSVIWGVVLSEASHVLCCVFPAIFSLMSLAVGMGLAASMPSFMVHIHDLMHEWELPIIAFSGVLLVLGWVVTWYSDHAACCHSTGCSHGSCKPRKTKAHLILIAATALFSFNLVVYTFVHRSGIAPIGGEAALHQAGEHAHDHE